VSSESESVAHQRHRIESFSDIVIGFSLSLLAGRLVIPHDPNKLFSTGALIGFAVTFALIVLLWFSLHRLFLYYFEPTRVDNLLLFVQLGAIALIPYALEVVLRFRGIEREPLQLYEGLFLTINGTSALLTYRGFVRRWPQWSLDDRVKRWRPVATRSLLSLVLVVALVTVFSSVSLSIVCLWMLAAVPFLVRRAKWLPRFARGEAAGAQAHT